MVAPTANGCVSNALATSEDSLEPPEVSTRQGPTPIPGHIEHAMNVAPQDQNALVNGPFARDVVEAAFDAHLETLHNASHHQGLLPPTCLKDRVHCPLDGILSTPTYWLTEVVCCHGTHLAFDTLTAS